jgi:hypothetical protein
MSGIRNIIKENTMKKLLILIIGLSTLINCKTMDKTVVGGKNTIVVARGLAYPGVGMMPTVAPFNTVFSSDMEDCLKDLRGEGVTEVTSLQGTSSTSAMRSLFPLSASFSTSPLENCEATGAWR